MPNALSNRSVVNFPNKTYEWDFANKYFTNSTNPLQGCSKAVLVSFVKDLTHCWWDTVIETASSAISLKLLRSKSVEDDIASRKESFNLNPSNELFTLTIFQNSVIFVIYVTVPSTFLSCMPGWNFSASTVSSQKTFNPIKPSGSPVICILKAQ